MKLFLRYSLIFAIFAGLINENQAKLSSTSKPIVIAGTTAGALLVAYAMYKLSNPVLRAQIKGVFNVSNWKEAFGANDPITLLPKKVQIQVNEAAKQGIAQIKKINAQKSTGLITESQKNEYIKNIRNKITSETDYYIAKSNSKLVIDRDFRFSLKKGTVTSEELSKAVKDYIKNGGNKDQVLKDLKTDAKNFIDPKTGEPSITLDDWKNILEENGITDTTKLNDFTKSLGELEPYKFEVAQANYGNASEAFNSSLSKGMGIDNFAKGYENVYAKMQDMLIASGGQHASIPMDEAYLKTGYEFILTDYVRHPELFKGYKGNVVELLNEFRTKLGFSPAQTADIYVDLAKLSPAQQSRIGAGNVQPFNEIIKSIEVTIPTTILTDLKGITVEPGTQITITNPNEGLLTGQDLNLPSAPGGPVIEPTPVETPVEAPIKPIESITPVEPVL